MRGIFDNHPRPRKKRGRVGTPAVAKSARWVSMEVEEGDEESPWTAIQDLVRSEEENHGTAAAANSLGVRNQQGDVIANIPAGANALYMPLAI